MCSVRAVIPKSRVVCPAIGGVPTLLVRAPEVSLLFGRFSRFNGSPSLTMRRQGYLSPKARAATVHTKQRLVRPPDDPLTQCVALTSSQTGVYWSWAEIQRGFI